MRVLLCLLSDQHVPNLLSVHHFQPDRVILIRSEPMRKAAEYFLDALSIAKFSTELVEVLPLEDENSLASVRRCLHQAFGRFPEADWIANVTGGLKPMSIATYEFFKALDARVVYIDSRQPNDILGLDGQPAERCSHNLTLDEFMAGYGFEISKSWAKIREAEKRAREWWPIARAVAEHAPNQNLICVPDNDSGRDEWKQLRKNGLVLETRHTQHLPPQVRSAIVDAWALDMQNEVICGRIDSYQAAF